MATDSLPNDLTTIKKLLLLPDDVEPIEIIIAISSITHAVERFKNLAVAAEKELARTREEEILMIREIQNKIFKVIK